MPREIYGIDLGTTNSLIGLHSKNYLSDLIPSCVDINTGECGKTMFNNMDAKRSFKVDMSMGREGIMPRVASSYVLKELKRQAGGDCVKDVVISVPAYFTDNQRQATCEAAEKAGLNVCSLINEPTAAAIYIAQKVKGLYVVYDLGGGTFDVSIIDSRFGSYDVQATDGCILGGDNFDAKIMQFFCKSGEIPVHRINAQARNALRHFATMQKIKMQKRRETFEVDLTTWGGKSILFTPEDYVTVMKLTFAQTITTLKRLVAAYIPEGESYEIMLVGGSTRCPYLREWLHEETGAKVDELTYDPDRVVAQGAALYADMLASGETGALVSDVTRALSIGLVDGTVSTLVEANSKIPLSVERMFSNPVDANALVLDLYQGESKFAVDNELIGTLVWNYSEPKKAFDGQVIVTIDIDTKGTITFTAKELLCEPKVIVLDRTHVNRQR